MILTNSLEFQVVGADDLVLLMNIRNQCREFMTRHRDEINLEQQKKWWATLDLSHFLVYLVHHEGKCIGYGLINTQPRMENDTFCRSWLTGGLLPEARGKGLGYWLFLGLVQRAPWPAWLEVREDNPRAKKVYDKLGFSEVERKNGIITMRLP